MWNRCSHPGAQLNEQECSYEHQKIRVFQNPDHQNWSWVVDGPQGGSEALCKSEEEAKDQAVEFVDTMPQRAEAAEKKKADDLAKKADADKKKADEATKKEAAAEAAKKAAAAKK